MLVNTSTVRRIQVLYRILNKNQNVKVFPVRKYSVDGKVTIGDVSKEITVPKNPEYVPRKYFTTDPETGQISLSRASLRHLRWLLQKDRLGQDAFLLGRPGPARRAVAMQYLQLTQREVEYVALSRDTTEADLKQRREICDGSAKYFDQSAVRAATLGRVLVVDGVEKAERNVLPVLNNLLENREMHLEDGRFLVPASRYDALLKEHGEEELRRWGLVRVSEHFRVLALGLPVPRYRGAPLDPPLRSRFQARDVSDASFQEQLLHMQECAPGARENALTDLLSAATALLAPESIALGLPDFPADSLPLAAKLLENNPSLSTYSALYRFYPYKSFLPRERVKSVETLLAKFSITAPERPPTNEAQTAARLPKVEFEPEANMARVTLRSGQTISVPAGRSKKVDNPSAPSGRVIKDQRRSLHTQEQPAASSNELPASTFVDVEYHAQLLDELMQSHAVGDFCLIGPRGCGKSAVVSRLADLLNLHLEPIVLYQDMTSRDLIQQRSTEASGDTTWRNSALVSAALGGQMAVLDGIHRVHPSTLSVIHRLVHDRELQLHDGTRLLRHDRYDELVASGNTVDGLTSSGVLRIHPAFRIVALAEPPTLHGQNAKGAWLTPEMLSLFQYHEVRELSSAEEMLIMNKLYGRISHPLQCTIELAQTLRKSEDPTLRNLSGSLSTRQLLRIAHRMSCYPADSAYETINRAFLTKFLPSIPRNALENTMKKLNILDLSYQAQSQNKKCEVKDGILTIGNTKTPVYKTEALTKVPNILFYDVPQHTELLEWLLQDFLIGNHLLLVGNQGVGKNKITDRLLQLLNRPREYIQLHRDTTVQTLTLQPTIVDGVVVHEDSPLVKAIKFGHVLVVDEADKAPTHVTCILKTLVENGEMILSDGRRIVPENFNDDGQVFGDIVRIHPDFRMIVLANRPGFPFLGNDFFGALGDLFSCHSIDNPSRESEMQLLSSYGPNVPKQTLSKLVGAFSELRDKADRGELAYPYSTREVVNIVKHLEVFPNESLSDVIGNVLDFDLYSGDALESVATILRKHGLPVENVVDWGKIRRQKDVQLTVERKSGKDVKGPKHGKEDPKNEPHVGGNTWAGGTGGRDTAGLGGKGGPYRLDKGHTVHQLSDAEKDDIPEEVKRAAREMNRKAFEEKLREIKMSEYDADLYNQFSGAVAKQVQSLRVILSSLQAKSKERQWLKHQTSGELDDAKLIEGITGERSIYRRRGEHDPEIGAPQLKPKRLRLLVDVSGSMYRFNGYDGRLDRELEAVVLLMESFEGHEERFQYDIFGHSGEADALEFVNHLRPPKNEKMRLETVKMMHAHSQFCWSGDNTLSATNVAIDTLAKEDCDEAIVVVLSDANLRRYGIPAEKLAQVLTKNPEVQAYAVFIGSLGEEADILARALPPGRGYVCMDVAELPQILQQIFTSSMLS